MRRALLSSLLVLAPLACVPDKEGPAASPPPATPASVAVVAPAPAPPRAAEAAPRTPVPEGAPKWKSVPRDQNGFYAMLDGVCSQLKATRLGKDVVVHYGGGSLMQGQREGHASFVALRDDGLESIGDPIIASPTGIAGASLDDFWIADSTGSRSAEGAILHRFTAGKWKTYEKDQTHIHPWVDGGTIGTLGFAMANGDVWVQGSEVKPPASFHAGMPYPALSAFPTGDVLIVAQKDVNGTMALGGDGPLVARHWSPTRKVTEHALDRLLPKDTDDKWTWLHEVAPDEVYAVRGSRIVRWDGTAMRALARTAKGEAVKLVRRAASDDLWVLTEAGALQRITPTAATVMATPEPVVDMDGVDRGSAWIVGKSGKLFRRDGEGWKPVPLPSPAFSSGSTLKAKAVVVVSPEDVLLTAQYWEKAPAWKDQELHTALFRTKAVKETLRCNEPDPENNNIEIGRGFQSWPPMATAACTTPFAVLARRSKAQPKEDDWPRIRAALKGHPELGEVSLVDFVSGDRTFVGTKAKDLEAAKKIVQLAAKNDRLRPEIVCGEPVSKRTLAVDLATGTAAPK